MLLLIALAAIFGYNNTIGGEVIPVGVPPYGAHGVLDSEVQD